MIIDTHIHYNLSPLLEEWLKYWRKAQEIGVIKSIVVGANLETSQVALEIATQDKDLFASIGIHPDEINALNEQSLKELTEMAQNNKVIAIGEIGLDYFRLDPKKTNTSEIKEAQKRGFIKQIKLANQLNLPIIVHVRDAYQDALKIIKTHPPKNKFVLHCFSGTENYIKEMVTLGAYFGIDGNITYKNASNLRELLQLIPKNKIILETDSPYLPPMPHRGKVCEPWMIKLTANYLQEKFSLSKKQLLINSQLIFPSLAPHRPEF